MLGNPLPMLHRIKLKNLGISNDGIVLIFQKFLHGLVLLLDRAKLMVDNVPVDCIRY